MHKFFWLLLACLVTLSFFTFGCDDGSDGDGDTDTDTDSDTDTDADGDACEAAGANCGDVDDGSGGAVFCGECTAPDICGGGGANRCGEMACVPVGCDDVGAVCGDIDDGCEGTASCGGCDDGFDCRGNLCIEEEPTECEGEPMNSCGGCDALTLEPGAACPCTGSVAECITAPWPLGLVACEDGDDRGNTVTTLDETDDSVDEWSSVTGSFDVLLAEDVSGGHFDQDVDVYEVRVVDESWSFFEPEIEFVHPGGFEGEICVQHTSELGGDSDADWITCPPEGHGGNKRCCMPIPEEATTVAFGVEIRVTSIFDNTGTFRIELYSFGGAAACAEYTLRTRF